VEEGLVTEAVALWRQTSLEKQFVLVRVAEGVSP
jgi:hypothetical protein